MFSVRKKVCESVTTVMMLLIPVGVFVLLHHHVPVWAAGLAAAAALGASVWSGL